jgi:hypothetical protein
LRRTTHNLTDRRIARVNGCRGRLHDFAQSGVGYSAPAVPPSSVLTELILARMSRIEGWLEDEEADLLSAAARALARPGREPPTNFRANY